VDGRPVNLYYARLEKSVLDPSRRNY